jgi:nicotinate-nucleotide adenylyltransferase
MRLAIFGGTFDPIHNGHLTIARVAADELRLDLVLFVPAAHPPHKAGFTHAAYADRLRMVELACESDPRFEASRLEENTVQSYSIHTIERVRAQMAPADELFFIIGADAFAEIRTWLRWEDVVRSVSFIVVSRPGHEYNAPAGARVERLNSVEIPISSTGIRRAVAAKEYDLPLPERILHYILTHELYRPS